MKQSTRHKAAVSRRHPGETGTLGEAGHVSDGCNSLKNTKS